MTLVDLVVDNISIDYLNMSKHIGLAWLSPGIGLYLHSTVNIIIITYLQIFLPFPSLTFRIIPPIRIRYSLLDFFFIKDRAQIRYSRDFIPFRVL